MGEPGKGGGAVFFRPFGTQFGLKIRRGGAPPLVKMLHHNWIEMFHREQYNFDLTSVDNCTNLNRQMRSCLFPYCEQSIPSLIT